MSNLSIILIYYVVARLIPFSLHLHLARIIYEIKPRLNSISGMIGQIKQYADFIVTDSKRYGMLIITYDDNNEFDSMLNSQGIEILHLTTRGLEESGFNDWSREWGYPRESSLAELFWGDYVWAVLFANIIRHNTLGNLCESILESCMAN